MMQQTTIAALLRYKLIIDHDDKTRRVIDLGHIQPQALSQALTELQTLRDNGFVVEQPTPSMALWTARQTNPQRPPESVVVLFAVDTINICN